MESRTYIRNIFFHLLCLACMFFPLALSAQDTLYYDSGKKLPVKVILVNLDKVVYKKWPVDTLAPLYSVPRFYLRRIYFESGTMLVNTFTRYKPNQEGRPLNKAGRSAKNRTILKTDVMSWFSYRGSFSIEERIVEKLSLEFTYGLAGGGFAESSFKEQGVKGDFYKGGLKFTFSRRHPQEGFYIKPEYVYLNYTHSQPGRSIYIVERISSNILRLDEFYFVATNRVTGKAGIINFGWQQMLTRHLVCDLYLGVGIGRKDKKLEPMEKPYRDADEIFFSLEDPDKELMENNIGFMSEHMNKSSAVMQGGIKIGIIF